MLLRFYCLAPLLFYAFFFLQGCAVNPVTGKQELMLLSEDAEFQLGQETDRSVIQQYGLYDDEQWQSYLQKMGQSLGRISHRPHLNWKFKVMDSEVVNAFAAPGGYIYVTRGLLAAINDEAELAGVLGHEIGHVTARHSAQRYSNMMLANLGLNLGQGLLGDYGDLLGPMIEAGASLLFLKFSRDDEREADALGVEYATRGGYDASRMATFFDTLEKQPKTHGQESSRLPEFLSTHPSPVNRKETVDQLAKDWRSKLAISKQSINRKAYLNMVDGLTYGKDPRKGYLSDNWFYFPQYQVKLPVPDSWKIEQEGQNLQISHPQNEAVILVGVRPNSDSDNVIAAFLKKTSAQVVDHNMSTKGDLSLKTLLSILGQAAQRTVILSSFYQKGPDVFVFHGISSEQNFSTWKNTLQLPSSGFTKILDKEKLNPKPNRIVVRAPTTTVSLDAFLAANGVEREFWDTIAWINSRLLTDQVAAGETIKIIVKR